MSLSEIEKYKIITTRDLRYAGQFIAAIRTTGIYCRPGCPARTPKAENCLYFDTIEAARAAGYRACKRCHPDTPFCPPSMMIDRALAALKADPHKNWSEKDVRGAGWDNSTLRRHFQKRFGMSFLAYARKQRLSQAAKYLQRGERVIAAQLEAGYESASGFRAAYKAQFGVAPSMGLAGSPKADAASPLFIEWIETPLGRMISIADEQGLFLLEFTDRKNMAGQMARLMRYYTRPILPGTTKISEQIRGELAAYFDGKLTQFQTPLKFAGTAFQSSVWQALTQIPYGQTCSYAQLAQDIGAEKAVRAVASTNARNALAIIVPCHRVIGKNGKLTGYAGGIGRKDALLRLEGAIDGGQAQLGLERE